MAGAGYKLFNTGDVLTAAQVNTYLQEQTVMVFASSTARTTALSGVLAEGMMSYLQDTNSVEVYNGSSWVALASGDLTEIVAGTGITVTSGTGPIPTVALTTPVAATNGGTAQSTYTTGDLLYASGTNTLAKRAIGTTGQVLTVSGGVPTWAAPAASATISAVRKSSDQSISSSTTLTNDSQLKFAVGANETWIFVCWLSAISTAGSINIKKTFTGPSGSTILHSPPDVAINSDGVIRVQQVYAGGTSFTGYTDNLQRPQWMMGTILNGSTAGDLQLQWAQDTSSATAQTVKAGSFIYGIKVS